MHSSRLVPAFFLLLSAACQDKPRHPTVAGGATATGAVAVSAQPATIIAPVDSEGVPVLGNVADATRLSSGLIAVADRGVDAVMFFDAKGEPLGRSGRSGDGPGEFRSIAGIGQCAPDTLFVWDRMNDRMSILDVTGGLLQSYRPPGDPVERFCAGATEYLVWKSLSTSGNYSVDAPPVRGVSMLVSASGDSTGGLGDIQAGQVRPLGAVTQFAVTKAGIYVGTADTALVSLYGRSGRVLRSVAVGNARRTTTAAEYDATLARLINTVPGTADEAASMREFLLNRFPMPKYLPSYRAIFTNGNGVLFVVTSPLGDGITELQVFDQDGANIGEVRIPEDLEVFEIGSDYLLGMSADAEGEQRLVVYELGARNR